MVKNNNLKPVLKKWRLKENEKVNIKVDVENINVKLIYAPTEQDVENLVKQWCSATWCDKPAQGEVFEKIKEEIIDNFWKFKNVLPSVYETINLTFLIEGIEHTTASHLIRHRTLSFSARTHADRDNRDDIYTVPGSIKDSNFYNEYKELIQRCVDLYGKMLDSEKISSMDARAILPRSEETYYYMRGNLKDLINFIKIRIDVQTQPQTDNILAMLIYKEIVKQYPKIGINKIVDFEQKDLFYIKAARTNIGHNIFAPAKKNDIFEWNEKDFIYSKHRDEFIGAHYYLKRKEQIIKEINEIIEKYKNKKF